MKRWRRNDYLFAIAMTLSLVLSAFAVAAVVPAQFEAVAWGPIGGLLLTVGLARLERLGSVALLIGPLALVPIARSPVLSLYLALTILLTEIGVGWRWQYGTPRHRLWAVVVFFVSAVGLGAVTAGWLLPERFGALQRQPGLIVGLAGGAGVMGAIGWWLGEQVVRRLPSR